MNGRAVFGEIFLSVAVWGSTGVSRAIVLGARFRPFGVRVLTLEMYGNLEDVPNIDS